MSCVLPFDKRITAKMTTLLFFRCKTPFCSCSAWRPCLARRGHRRHHSFCSSLNPVSKRGSKTYGMETETNFLYTLLLQSLWCLTSALDYTHDFHAEKQSRAQAKSSTVQEIHIAQRTMSLKDMRQQKNVRHRVSRRSKWTKVCTVQKVQESFQTFFSTLDLYAF